MSRPASILIVDGNAENAETLTVVCTNLGFRVDPCSNATLALEMFSTERHAVVLVDYRVEPGGAILLIEALRSIHPEIQAIIMTDRPDKALVDFLGETSAVTLLLHPVRHSELVDQIRVATQRDRGATEQLCAATMAHRMDQCLPLLGCSPALVKVREQIAELGPTRFPILVEGPFGVGKPEVAKFIHHSGGYSESPFVICPCDDLNRGIIEARLLAASGGWGTDVAKAEHGTLVLSHFEWIPVDIQQELARQFDTLSAHCRVITWANHRIDDLLDAGVVDAELYFKLTLHTIHLPALAERPVDIEEITRFVAAAPDLYGLARRIRGVELDLLVAELRRSELKENLRELIQAIRAASLGESLIG